MKDKDQLQNDLPGWIGWLQILAGTGALFISVNIALGTLFFYKPDIRGFIVLSLVSSLSFILGAFSVMSGLLAIRGHRLAKARSIISIRMLVLFYIGFFILASTFSQDLIASFFALILGLPTVILGIFALVSFSKKNHS